MVINDIEKHIAIGREIILYSKTNLRVNLDLKIGYRINKEDKEIRLYDVPKILTFQEKVMVYYAILDKYYFYPLRKINNEFISENIENYIIKENGYTFHEFNGIEDKPNGILGELIFEIPRQEIEPEKLSRIRDIYDMLMRNKNQIGDKPICIAFNGIMPDFEDVFRVIQYMFEHDKELSKKKDKVKIFRRSGILGGNKRIFIVSNRIIEED